MVFTWIFYRSGYRFLTIYLCEWIHIGLDCSAWPIPKAAGLLNFVSSLMPLWIFILAKMCNSLAYKGEFGDVLPKEGRVNNISVGRQLLSLLESEYSIQFTLSDCPKSMARCASYISYSEALYAFVLSPFVKNAVKRLRVVIAQ
ncbi:hypothetical protein BDP27DRAFT_1337878 [Rhodocollybia butyracea]|uniref:Uncharacterized protein n=1 Tax=Rhodocollybia butyracea TaxID=206335 RepID=A0A9P5PGD2_9AGAR|nr:hypothetical protein BDP27DRAFT_1337878 [Rhodocollybia butyracea]